MIRLHPITLKFIDHRKSIEDGFLNHYFENKVLQMQISLIVGLFFYLSFGILDIILIPEKKTLFLSLRFFVMAPVVIITLLLSLTKYFRKTHQIVLFINNFVGAGIIMTMILIAKPPTSYLYYAGEILVVLFAFTFSGSRFIWSLFLSFSIISFYEVSAIWISHTPINIIINNNFFLISANILSLVAAYFLEKSLRYNYYNLYLLEEERDKVILLNEKLEDKVLKRTEELNASNQILEKELLNSTELLNNKKILHEQLVHSQKMEAIGHLAGGVAHDFNNILTVINGYSEMILDSMTEDVGNYEAIEQIFESGQKAATLTAQLLAFSRKQVLIPEIIDINKSIRNLEKMIKRLLESNIDISFSYFNEPLKIKVDSGQFEQVILNLVINARDAMPEGGKLTINISSIIIPKDNHTTFNKEQEGSFVVITIIDSGIGMNRETIQHIFEPFYTTKEVGKGTGLGLSTVFGIITQSNGNIYVKSKSGKGTEFNILFPLFDTKDDVEEDNNEEDTN